MTRALVSLTALMLPLLALGASNSTPAGIAKQCEKYGYVSDLELSDIGNALAVVQDETRAALSVATTDYGDTNAALDEVFAVVGMDGGNLLMSAQLVDSDGPDFVFSHQEGPASGGDISVGDDNNAVTLSYGEAAFFTVVQNGADAIVYVEIMSGSTMVDQTKFLWEGGACPKDQQCSYDFGFDMVDLDHTGDGDSWGTVLGNTARANGPLVKAVKSLTGLGLD